MLKREDLSKRKINGILVIHRHNLAPTACMVVEIVNAFCQHSEFKAWEVSAYFGFPEVLRELEFKVIVLHYSLFAYLPFVEEEFRAYIAECGSSYKVAFFQDEHWFWPESSEMLNRFKVECVYTCIEPEYYEATYWKYTRVPRLVTYLPGYVSEEMVEVASRVSRPDGERRVDIGYRGRLSPDFIWLGKGACEKYEIGVSFREMAVGAGLVLDIETEESKRIYGDAWLAFLGDCRAVLGVEAGASIFDIDNTIFPRYRRFREEHPELSVEQVYERVLFEYDGKGVCYRTMSPRLFEAAAVHSCQILFEGRYSGILKPMVHYIPLKKDFSNFDEVIAMFRDESLRRELTDNAYRDLIASGQYSYQQFIKKFDQECLNAGLKQEIKTEEIERIDNLLREAENVQLKKLLEAKSSELQDILSKYVGLQFQYMEQQKTPLHILLKRIPGDQLKIFMKKVLNKSKNKAGEIFGKIRRIAPII